MKPSRFHMLDNWYPWCCHVRFWSNLFLGWSSYCFQLSLDSKLKNHFLICAHSKSTLAHWVRTPIHSVTNETEPPLNIARSFLLPILHQFREITCSTVAIFKFLKCAQRFRRTCRFPVESIVRL